MIERYLISDGEQFLCCIGDKYAFTDNFASMKTFLFTTKEEAQEFINRIDQEHIKKETLQVVTLQRRFG